MQRLLRTIALCTVLATPFAAPLTTQADDQLTTEQQQDIDNATDIDELARLSRQFLMAKETTAAKACIQRICTIDPAQLTDDSRQSPTSWHTFWFTQRAIMREQALADDDAEGRVTLARWLHDARLNIHAGDMLRRALTIDSELVSARKLADEWHLFGGGPIDFDLNLAFNGSLLHETTTDGNATIKPRKDHTFLIVPFRYKPVATKRTLRLNDLKVLTDTGTNGRVMGIILLTASPDRSITNLFFSGRNNTVYEQIQIPSTKDKDVAQLTCFDLRSLDSTARNKGNTNRKTDVAASGYAAFIVEVPQNMIVAQCELAKQAIVNLDLDFIRTLSAPTNNLSLNEQYAMAQGLSSYALMADSAIASAAVRKLLELRHIWLLVKEADQAHAKAMTAMDKLLVYVVGHPNGEVRDMAFNGLVSSRSDFAKSAERAVTTCDQPHVQAVLLEKLAALFSPPTPAASPEITRTEAPLPEAAFGLLQACLLSQDADMRSQAIRIAMEYGSAKALQLLDTVGAKSDETILAAFQHIDDEAAQLVMLRSLVDNVSAESIPTMLAALPNVKPIVTKENDPLLLLFSRASNAQQAIAVLKFMSRADLSAIETTKGLAEHLNKLNATIANNADAITALGEFAASQCARNFRSPLRQFWPVAQSGKLPTQNEWSAFADMLAQVALTPPPSKTQYEPTALKALLSSGRIDRLIRRLEEAKPEQQQHVIQSLISDRDMWQYDGTAMLLAHCARYPDKTQQLAMSALTMLYQQTPSIDQWRLDTAVRQSLDYKTLDQIAKSSQPAVLEQTEELLVRQCRMGKIDLTEWREANNPKDRLELIETLRSTPPIAESRLRCLVILSVSPADEPNHAYDVVLPSITLVTSTGKQLSQRLLANGKEIGNTNAPAGIRSEFEIDAAPLLITALESSTAQQPDDKQPDDKQRTLKSRIDSTPLTQPVKAQLQSSGFGSQRGHVSLAPGSQSKAAPLNRDTAKPATGRLIIREAWILLEPVGKADSDL